MNGMHIVIMGVSSSTRRYVAVVLVTIAFVTALPIAAVFSMGSSVLTFLASTPNAAAAETEGFYMGGPVEGNTYAWGNCTYWSYAMRLWAGSPIPTTWGNANTWDDRARADGYIVNSTPALGAIFQTDAGVYGHVAYVSSVDVLSGQWTISEMNVKGLNMVSRRVFHAESAAHYSFIHSKEGAEPWMPLPISLP